MAVHDQGPASDMREQGQGAYDSLLSSTQDYAGRVATKGQAVVDGILPPESRNALLEKSQAFIHANPKLSAFLAINLLFTGIPLGLFILFAFFTTLGSLVFGLLLGLLGAVLFILVAVGTAFCIVLPAIFFTTTCACFLFAWGLVGYYILKWVNGTTSEEAPQGRAIANKLDALTSGRFTEVKDRTSNDSKNGGLRTLESGKGNGTVNGIAKKAPKKMDDAAQRATPTNGADGILKTEIYATSTGEHGGGGL